MRHSDIDHGFARCGVPLIVLAMSPVAPQPAEGSLHDPTLRQHHKTLDLRRPQDRLQQPAERVLDALRQVVPAVGAVGEDHLQATESGLQVAEEPQDPHRSVVVLNVRRMDDYRQDQPQRVDDNVTLAAVDLLGGVVSPPTSVVFTVWLSMIAALGDVLRPSRRRSMSRSES
jgi:hypothetical protein